MEGSGSGTDIHGCPIGSAGRGADFEGSGRQIDIDGFPIKRAGTGADVGSGSNADGVGLPTGPG